MRSAQIVAPPAIEVIRKHVSRDFALKRIEPDVLREITDHLDIVQDLIAGRVPQVNVNVNETRIIDEKGTPVSSKSKERRKKVVVQ